jgi:subtilisin-like proprotein convertase family protein
MSQAIGGRRAERRAAVLMLCASLALPAGALAISRPTIAPPGGGLGTTKTFTNAVVTPIPFGTTNSLLNVSGMGKWLWDVDLVTDIGHAFPTDLDIVLTSPQGKSTTITTDNGGSATNAFAGTRWDDQAATSVNNETFAANVVEVALQPEGAMGRLRGQNPNGTWTLKVTDDFASDDGTLNRWSLRITTFTSEPYTSVSHFENGTDTAIPDTTTITSTIAVSGLSASVIDVDVKTHIIHAFPGDLDMSLTSPEGRTVVITTDNGSGTVNAFNGTNWNDQASSPVSDHAFSSGVVATPLIPEGAMSAFHGENPNGTWTLTIADDAAGDVGTLDNWRLSFRTGSVLTCDGKQATLVRFSSGTVNGSSGADVIAVRDGTFTVDGKGGNDTICAAGGDDLLVGGSGDDRIFGGGGADRLRGDSGEDQLFGQKGPDSLNGGTGSADLCSGGSGSDALSSSCEAKRQ